MPMIKPKAKPAPGQPQLAANPAIIQLEQQAAANPDDLKMSFDLITAHIGAGNTNRAFQLLQGMVARKPNDFTTVASAAQAYAQLKRPQEASRLLETLLQQTNLDANSLTTIAHLLSEIGDVVRLEKSLTKLTAILPDSPEAWYDLAAIRAVMGSKNQEALKALSKAIHLSNARLTKDPNAGNLIKTAQGDNRFQTLKNQPGYAQALQGAL
jgi:tetratricopeptide (TPR) repeat protein